MLPIASSCSFTCGRIQPDQKMWNQVRDERAAHLLAGRLRACSSGGGGARLLVAQLLQLALPRGVREKMADSSRRGATCSLVVAESMPWRTLSRTSEGGGGEAKNLASRWLRRALRMILSSTSVMFITCTRYEIIKSHEERHAARDEKGKGLGGLHHENVVAEVVLHHPAEQIEGQVRARMALVKCYNKPMNELQGVPCASCRRRLARRCRP